MSAKADSKMDARLAALLKRASFELRLAADLAAFESDDLQLRALVEGARGNLRRCLSRLEGQAASSRVMSDER